MKRIAVLANIVGLCGCAFGERQKALEEAQNTVASLQGQVNELAAAGTDPQLLEKMKLRLDQAAAALKVAEDALLSGGATSLSGLAPRDFHGMPGPHGHARVRIDHEH